MRRSIFGFGHGVAQATLAGTPYDAQGDAAARSGNAAIFA